MKFFFQMKSRTENHTKHFVFSNFLFFSKIVPFMGQCGNALYGEAGHR